MTRLTLPFKHRYSVGTRLLLTDPELEGADAAVPCRVIRQVQDRAFDGNVMDTDGPPYVVQIEGGESADCYESELSPL